MSPSGTSAVSRLQAIAPILPAQSMADSVAFYQRLGFSSEPYEDGSEYCFLVRDDLSLHLRLADPEELHRNPAGVYFYLDDVDTFVDEIAAAGVAVIHEPADKPWRMRELALSDPDGTLLRFGHHLHMHL